MEWDHVIGQKSSKDFARRLNCVLRKICVVTGSRAEYGLLRWVMQGILNSDNLELQICVTGMHLSPEFGLTYKEIENDGFTINAKVDSLISSIHLLVYSKSWVGCNRIWRLLDNLKPDLLVVLGDRFEILPAVFSALFAGSSCPYSRVKPRKGHLTRQ